MRVIIFGQCVSFALGVFVAMFVSIWSTQRRGEACLQARQSLGTQLA